MIKSWSYSQLSSYEQCPHAHMYKRIVKLPEPPSWHLTNGNYVHSLAENYLLGRIEELPKELSKFKNEFANLKSSGAIPEQALVLDSTWSLIGGEEAWKHENAWLRLKIDATVGDDFLIDFKTGKVYPDHVKQAKLYSNVKMMLDMHLDEVTVEFWYLNSGEVVDFTFYRADLDVDIADWERRVSIMHNDETYIPTPHQWCRNCYVKEFCNAYE
jgi:hypothetical protein